MTDPAALTPFGDRRSMLHFAHTRESRRLRARTTRPSPFRRRIAPALAAAVLTVGWSGTATAADRIWLRSGGRPVVADQVLQDHYDKVVYRRSGNRLELPGRKVREIDWGDAPESFRLGLEKLRDGDYENAVNLFKAAATESGVRGWIKVEAPFRAAEALRAWGGRDPSKLREAIAQYDAALEADPKTRLRPAILYGRALARLGLGDIDGAVADLDALKKEAAENGYGIEWELRAALERAQALDDAGRSDEARRAYSALEQQARVLANAQNADEREKAYALEVAGLARLAQGRVLIGGGKASQAESFFRRIVDDEREAEPVRAAALVGLGEALMAQGKLKEAQLALARVRVRYFHARDAVAHATYLLGEIAERLGRTHPQEARLAQTYYLEVAERYGDTRWARKAQEKLN